MSQGDLKGSLPIAHLDSGMDGNHPLLNGKIVSFTEIDQDGCVYHENQAYDLGEHGTITAQLIIEQCPNVMFHSVAMPRQGKVVLNILKGLYELLDSPAKIVCLALGIPAPSPIFRPLVEAFERKGVLLVAAIGNNGPEKGLAPACYPEVVSVGAMDRHGQVASFSATWKNEPDVIAPGTGIKSYASDRQSQISQGTSMAAAQVVGVAAQLWREFPEASHADIREALKQSAKAHAHRLIQPVKARAWLESHVPLSISVDNLRWGCDLVFIDPRFSLQFNTCPDWAALEALIIFHSSGDPKSDFQKLESQCNSKIEFWEPVIDAPIIHLKAEKSFFKCLLDSEKLRICHAVDADIF